MSTTTYTTTIDFDHRAKRDDGRRNNTREARSTRESYMRDVMALEIKSLRKRKVLYVNLAVGGGGLAAQSAVGNNSSIKNFLKKSPISRDNTPTKNFLKKIVYKADIASI